MEIVRMPLDQLVPAPYNPRRDLKPGDPEYEALRRSLNEFGLVEPLVWNRRTGRLVGGHQRLKVLRELGVREVEVSVVDLDPERERLLNLALNKIQGDWDEDRLRGLLAELEEAGADLSLSGFSEEEVNALLAGIQQELEKSDEDEDEDDQVSPYTYKIDAVQYQPRGECPAIADLADTSRYEELLRRVEEAPVEEELKQFLRLAATRFIRFNFSRIAEYYAHAPAEVQRLFEALALVIVDFNDAIAHGFLKFNRIVREMFEEEYGDEYDE